MNEMNAIEIRGLKKMYKLGQIGGGTLQGDLQSWWARVRGKEDPNSKIGSDQRSNGKTFMALNGIDMTVKKGEALGIIGHNGAGKSTLLKLLSRVTAPTEGEIEINGRIASMLEVGTGFNGEMTGRENVYMNGAILGMTRAEVDAKMEQIIEFSEVREFIDTPVKRYSSGMYVKLAFSVAAHLDSEIMIMDEVLAVGDMAFQKKCLDKMREAANKEGRTVLYVSHNMNTIRQLCDRCVVLDKGRVSFEGDVEEAIGVYLGENGQVSNFYKYTKTERCHASSNDNIVIDSLKILSECKSFHECGDLLNLQLEIKLKREIEDFRIRFEVFNQGGIVVGTMISNAALKHVSPGDHSLQLQMDTTGLVPGRYRVDIVAYSMNEFGVETFLDGVYPGFILELNSFPKKEADLIWKECFWGYVKLKDINMKSTCS